MPYLEIPLDNGHAWGLHANELIIPGDSLEGMTPEQIGLAVLAGARLTQQAHAYFQDHHAALTLEDFGAFLRSREEG